MILPNEAIAERLPSSRPARASYDWLAVLVAIAAIVATSSIIGPEQAPNPVSSGRFQVYAVVVGVIAVTLGLFWSSGLLDADRPLLWRASRAFLVTVAPGIYVVGRIRPLALALIVASGVLVAIVSRVDGNPVGLMLTTAVFAWMAIIGTESLHWSLRVSLPFTALISSTAGVWLCRAAEVKPAGWLIGVAGLIGAQIAFVLGFQGLAASAAASLWLGSVAAVLALITSLETGEKS